MTVRELLARVDSHELSEWRAFYSLEPFGSEADLYGQAMNAAHIINSRRKRKDAVKVQDLMPKREKQRPIEEAIGFAATMTAMYGGKDERE